MQKQGRYDHLSREALIAQLERRDALRRYGLVWEREGIERERAINDDFVALDLDLALSTTPQDDRGWRNFVIEGDNWDVLRALRLAYTGRIKCILIDPPYNTGNRDFVYNDNFVGRQDRYRQSVWLEFLYRRLLLARDLLADDGVILVCINDENRGRLDLLMEQVFPGMRVGSFVWRTKDTNNSDKRRYWSGVHEHVLVYANRDFAFIGPDAGPGKFRVRPEYGGTPVRLDPITKAGTFTTRANTYYPIQNPKTGLWYPCAPNRVWAYWSEAEIERQRQDAEAAVAAGDRQARRRIARPGTEPSIESFIRAGEIHFPEEARPPFFYETRQALDDAIAAGNVPRDGKGRPLLRSDLPRLDFWVGRPIAHGRLSRVVFQTAEEVTQRKPVGSWIAGLGEPTPDDSAHVLRSERQGAATAEIEHIFGAQAFSFPKPSSLIRALVQVTTGEGDIVLDFFAGSGTAGVAALALNAQDEADRRFILVSSTEANTDEPDKNLCRDVCAARLRRALAGQGGDDPLPGDFAYLRAKRLAWDDVLYDLDQPAIWTLLQLRYDRPLRAFDSTASVQISRPAPDQPEDNILAYVTELNDSATMVLRDLAAEGGLVVFTPVPGRIRDTLAMPAVPIEAVPDRLLADFPRVVAGL